MITLHNITKSYGTRPLFEDVTCSFMPGERIGLVGRNGQGKTTLMRIITGEESADSGTVEIAKGYRIGFLKQIASFSSSTVHEEGVAALPEHARGEEWRVKRILMGLGFSENDFGRSPGEFSGGYQMRLSLAKVLLSDPHALFLDEPTNYLDIVTIRWLESFLQQWPHELVVISHDRQFMDAVTTSIMGIHRKRVRTYNGKTKDYYAQIAQDEAVYEKERINAEKKKKQMEQFITKFRAKARQASLAQSRMKTIEKMDFKEKLETIDTLSFGFSYKELPSNKVVIEARDVSFSYTDQQPALIKEFSCPITNGDRIGVIGKNGAGKTTLLKVLLGELPLNGGAVKTHPSLAVAYYEQSHTRSLNDENTVEGELQYAATDETRPQARNVCGAMMFSGDDAHKKIRVLSGGERCRVLLGKLLLTPSNVIVLDEPTHHLDMESCDALIEAVREFPGATIVVTHDERFLKAVATKLIVFDGGSHYVFPGTYDEFLEQRGWSDEDDAGGKKENKKARSRRERAERVQEKSRRLQPVHKEIARTEKAVETAEADKERIEAGLVTASEQGDGGKITALSADLTAINQKIDALYEKLEKSYAARDRIEEEYA